MYEMYSYPEGLRFDGPNPRTETLFWIRERRKCTRRVVMSILHGDHLFWWYDRKRTHQNSDHTETLFQSRANRIR
jgi:hypothetical protein